MKLKELFQVQNGLASSDLIIQDSKSENSTLPYIRPTQTWKNLIVGYLDASSINSRNIYPADTLFVSTNGEGSHSYAYVSPFEFVPNSDVSVLIPKRPMDLKEKIFYAMCITKNRYKFSYGRKPKGERLGNIILPDNAFDWVKKTELPEYELTFDFDETQKIISTNSVSIHELFHVKYGTSLELNRLEECTEKGEDTINFVSRTSQNNGVSAIVKRLNNVKAIQGGVLSVAGGGSVLETFLQEEPFYSGRDIFYLIPKKPMTNSEKLFYCLCIRANKYRFSYGRQANRSLKTIQIPKNPPEWLNKTQIDLLLKRFE
jgi:hypothetical protein